MAKIIHLVGPSGTGKTSVHKALTPLLQGIGYEVVPLVEPGPLREQIKEYKKSPHRNPYTEALLFAADRSLLYAQDVLPRLHEPNVLFTFARGLPDSVVYQGMMQGLTSKVVLNLNQGIPPSDVYIALVVYGNEGHRRIVERSTQTGQPISPNETPEAINRLTQHYYSLNSHFPTLKIIDTTSCSLEEVTQQCFAHILAEIKDRRSQ